MKRKRSTRMVEYPIGKCVENDLTELSISAEDIEEVEKILNSISDNINNDQNEIARLSIPVQKH